MENLKKKHVNSMSYDHVTVVNRYPILQLSIDHYMDGCYQVKHRLQAPTLARKFDILHWLSWVRMDRRTDVQSCVISNPDLTLFCCGRSGYEITVM